MLSSQECVTHIIAKPRNEYVTIFFANPPRVLYFMNILFLLWYFPSSPNIPPFHANHLNSPPLLWYWFPYWFFDRLVDGQGWVGTLDPQAHLCSSCVCCHVFRSHRLGLCSCVPDLWCDDYCIHHCLQTGNTVPELCVCPAGNTTQSIPSKSSDPFCHFSSASTCGRPFHIPPCSGLWSGFNTLWPVLWVVCVICIRSGRTCFLV